MAYAIRTGFSAISRVKYAPMDTLIPDLRRFSDFFGRSVFYRARGPGHRLLRQRKTTHSRAKKEIPGLDKMPCQEGPHVGKDAPPFDH